MKRQDRTHAVTRSITLLPIGICGAALLLGLAQPASAGDRDLDRSQWMARVTDSLNANIRSVDVVPHSVRQRSAAVVAASFDADGMYRGVTLAKPTGTKRLDREAIRAVSSINFPRMPIALRGQNRTVALEVFFSDPGLNPKRTQIRNVASKIAREHTKSNAASLNS